ncbi:probable MSP1 AAA ATPase protein [Cephalotrichum gorgonifer]|uniref:Probable MSP1 AAA ATPase protein n=1 Tax=Cephalotrichum gorgonifer TaxID=2041049 RepID=A0AAE8N585_9PEZI|nr:probable MSP1 AAA ATPase protein [Cephalotrichum gorgonifer]
MSDKRRIDSLAVDFLLFAGLMATGAYVIRQVISSVTADPEREKHEQASVRAKAHLERLQREKDRRGATGDAANNDDPTTRVEDLSLNQYENIVAMDMVAPQDIHVGFDDIGGLDGIIEELRESVIYPLTMPQLYSHGGSLLSAPSGVLLYGPPGCGKTMLAKALAHESGASFINLHISTLLEKWYGDSNKLVRAVFTLARKMQPAIVFIDEIDAVLRMRANSDHEASAMVKAEFMTLWDGLASASPSGQPARIVVLGATNRIHDIDEAILRRMPKKFAIPLPGAEQRLRILNLILSDAKTDAEDFNIDYIVKVTAGMSGSDIKEACRDAAMVPVREFLRENRGDVRAANSINPDHIRGIRTQDFFGRIGGQSLADTKRRSEPATTEADKGSTDDFLDAEAESLG